MRLTMGERWGRMMNTMRLRTAAIAGVMGAICPVTPPME
jgi:hypothetical protein